MANLAIKGGTPLRKEPLPNYQVMGDEEAQAAYNVVKTGILSDFLGTSDAEFFGGTQVKSFEKEWAQHFHVKHAVSVNSNTSGIIAALGAAGVGPGDEVIVSPYSMSISASAPLFWGALPVFADIEPDYFCLDPVDVERKITPRTKAIIVVDIFGQVFAVDKIMEIAARHGLVVIEDCAQAPGALWKDRWAGSLGHVGVFSLNYHKHIHTGEGGVIVTNDDDLALRCQLIRNHAETVVDGMAYSGSPVNMVGMNLRMTEVEAAIGREQLKKLDRLLSQRFAVVETLEKGIQDIPFLQLPKRRPDTKHAFYVHVLKYNDALAGVPRSRFVEAVNTELLPTGVNTSRNSMLSGGYVKPLYWQSLYQNKTGIGQARVPFSNPAYGKVEYPHGLCPITERMHTKEVIVSDLIHPSLQPQDVQDIIDAFHKVANHLNELV